MFTISGNQNTSSKILELRGEATKRKEMLVAYRIVCSLYMNEGKRPKT